MYKSLLVEKLTCEVEDFGLYGSRTALIRRLSGYGVYDGVIDTFRSLVGDIQVFQHPLVGAALALQVPAVNPLPGNTLYLSEEVQLGLLIFITEVLEKQQFPPTHATG